MAGTKWLDTTAFPDRGSIADTDLFPVADMTQAPGSRQRTTTGAALRAYLAGQAAVNSTAPGVNDDETNGFVVGSLWYDETGEAFYVAVDVTEGAAVWDEVAGGGGGGTPGGSDTQLQFNDATVFAGAAGLTWNKTTGLLTNTGQLVGTPPATAAARTLIGQGVTTEVGHYIAPAADITSGERYYTVAIEATGDQAGDSVDGHVVPLYTAANGKRPGGAVWALNSLVRVDAAMTSGDAIGFELDVNNHGPNSLTPASALKVWGMTVSGGGSGRRISPFSVQGPASGWNYGLTFYNNALSGGQAYVFAADSTPPAYGIDFSTGEFGTAAIRLKTTGRIRWNDDVDLERVDALGLRITAAARTELSLRGGSETRKSRVQQFGASAFALTDNARWNGSGWDRDDTGQAAARFDVQGGGNVGVFHAPAGSNPATFAASFYVTPTHSVVTGHPAVLATSATDGFLYIPNMAGAPSGAPTARGQSAAMVLDTTNSRIYFRVGGTWKYATLT